MIQISPDKKEDFSFWKNIALVVVFFTLTPFALLLTLYSLFTLSNTQANHVQQAASPNQIQAPSWGVRVYASLPTKLPSISGEASATDSRKELIRQYLALYNSPLEPYAPLIISSADEHGLDFRLTTAIAQQESNLCKKIPTGSYNCWGWGIHSQGTLGFESYEDGIKEISKGLREKYLDEGLTSIEDIMDKYTPLSEGSWAYAVNQFMQELE